MQHILIPNNEIYSCRLMIPTLLTIFLITNCLLFPSYCLLLFSPSPPPPSRSFFVFSLPPFTPSLSLYFRLSVYFYQSPLSPSPLSLPLSLSPSLSHSRLFTSPLISSNMSDNSSPVLMFFTERVYVSDPS